MSSMTPDAKSGSENPTDRNVKEEDERHDASGSGNNNNNGASVRIKKKRLGVDPSLIISDERSKRRKTPTPDAENEVKEGDHDPKDHERAKQLGTEIYQRIMDSKASDGDSMSAPFIKLPNKRAFPDYYDTIKHPVSLEMVHEKLESASYDTLKAVVTDLGQIFNNAKRYNVKESVIFQYAKKLHKMTRTFYSDSTSTGPKQPAEDDSDVEEPHVSLGLQVDESGDGEDVDMGGPSNASADGESIGGKGIRKRGSYMKDGPTVYKLIKPVLKALRDTKARDGSGRDIAGIFEVLPDRKIFADYYKTIKDPISLKEIEDKMMARLYQTWEHFFEDVELMCSNAMFYNEDDSEVYRDAKQIKDVLDAHRKEVHERLNRPQVSKFRVKASSATPVRSGPESAPLPYGYGQTPVGMSPSPAFYPPQPTVPPPIQQQQQQPQSNTHPGFLPALPKGVVTEEIVASLERYPAYEQQAWANSLSPLAVQMYRQMAAVNEMKKRGISGIPHATTALAELPSAGRPNGVSPLPDRTAPPLPTIKYLDFAFFPAGQPIEKRQAIRLHNMRGVVTHAVVLGAETSELELTAYIGSNPAKAATTPAGTSTVEALETVPEVSLRVNGNQGSLPKFIFETEKQDRPAGMRWTINVPTSRLETKIEVVATKPGALTETSAIFVSRQY